MIGEPCHTYLVGSLLLCLLLLVPPTAAAALAGNRHQRATGDGLTVPKNTRLGRMGEEGLSDGFPVRQIARALSHSAFSLLADRRLQDMDGLQVALRDDGKELHTRARRLDSAANQVLAAVAPSIGNIKKHFHVAVNNLPLLTPPSPKSSSSRSSSSSSAPTSVADRESRRRARLVAGFLHPSTGIESDLVLLRRALLGRDKEGQTCTSIAEQYSDLMRRDWDRDRDQDREVAARLRRDMVGLLVYLFRLQDQAFAIWFLATGSGKQQEKAVQQSAGGNQQEADQRSARGPIEKERQDSLQEEFQFLASLFEPCDCRLLSREYDAAAVASDGVREQTTLGAVFVNCTNGGHVVSFGTVCYELCLLEVKGQRCRAWRCFVAGRWGALGKGEEGGAEGGKSASAAGSGRAWVLPFAFFVCFMLLIAYVVYGLRQPESQNSAPYDPD